MSDVYSKVLDRVDIVDVVSRYLPLKKNGSNYKACCPFHQENTPSFVVSQTKQIFKCFGCGVAGNAVSFVKEYEKISYYEAALKLAQQYGIKLNIDKSSRQKESKTNLILQIYSLAKDFYRENLALHGSTAIDYLKSRSISENTIKTFELGFSLNSQTALYNYLRKNNVNKDILLESGIVKSNNKGYYDLFSNRVVFPIVSSTGVTVAFGARAMDNAMPKYINSPTTAVYQKSKELYGFYITKHEIGKLDKVIICEGYLDFLRLYENGYHNAVASLGTSLTDEQVAMLRRYCKNFYILYDGDDAGLKATLRAASKVLSQSGEVRIVRLPEGEDPDSFLLESGKDALNALLEASPTYLQYLKDNLDLSEAMNVLVEVAGSISNQLDRFVFIKKVSEIFGVEESVFSSQVKVKKVYSGKDSKAQVKIPGDGLEEKLLLMACMSDREKLQAVSSVLTLSDFHIPEFRSIFEELVSANSEESINLNALACQSKSPEVFNELILESEQGNSVDFEQILNGFQIKKEVHAIKELDDKLINYLNSETDTSLMQEILLQKKDAKKRLVELGYCKTKI